MKAIVNHFTPDAFITVAGFGGSPQPSYRYGAAAIGAPPVGGGPSSAAGAFHFWFAAPVQLHNCSGVPFAELLPVTSRHLFACGFTRSRPEVYVHCWAADPLQVHSWTRAPLATEPPDTSRRLPRARTVPSLERLHCCAPVPLQSYSWTGVPSALFAAATSTHLPAKPVIAPVAACAGVAVINRPEPSIRAPAAAA